MRHPRRLLPVALLAAVLALSGCTSAAPQPSPSTTAPAAAVRFARLDSGDPAVVDAATAPQRAVQASRALFAASPGVVLAPDGDRAAQQAAAAVAERLHVPLLLTPEAPSSSPSPSAASSGSASASGSATPSSSASASPSSSSATPSPSATSSAELAAVAAEVQRLGATWVAGDDVPAVAGAKRVGLADAPSVRAPQPSSVVAVASGEGADTAALATARAAGAEVVSSDGSAIPGAASDVVAALSKGDAPAVLIGSAFQRVADEASWAVAAARGGYQYAGGGQVPFDGSRLFVALYGVPGDPVLGVLGEQGPSATVSRVKALADRYRPLTDRHVAPMLEIIATVASGSPTDNGDYSSDLDVSRLEPYVDAATKAGLPVVLDLQPGRSDFLTQAKLYESLLEKPNVGLALDPEWRLKPGQKPLVQIGSVSAAEVNRTSAWLADLVKEHGLPPKPFVLHQFQLRMLQDRNDIDVSRPELDVLIHVDGQGTQPEKQATWRALHQGAPDVAWGWKNFIDEDHPMLTPAQTMDEVHPTPDLVTYQ